MVPALFITGTFYFNAALKIDEDCPVVRRRRVEGRFVADLIGTFAVFRSRDQKSYPPVDGVVKRIKGKKKTSGLIQRHFTSISGF